ncbi:hypothetical protein FKW77_009161 [Venturia effusa]|uniref:Uncharacterized protein n=1 Tax=Venturia effusa TaxID=50376 RepID=A0A517LGD5_9PEZI|nr:hypothetical protein FKW77_009161 [Venturia effusa]
MRGRKCNKILDEVVVLLKLIVFSVVTGALIICCAWEQRPRKSERVRITSNIVDTNKPSFGYNTSSTPCNGIPDDSDDAIDLGSRGRLRGRLACRKFAMPMSYYEPYPSSLPPIQEYSQRSGTSSSSSSSSSKISSTVLPSVKMKPAIPSDLLFNGTTKLPDSSTCSMFDSISIPSKAEVKDSESIKRRISRL